MNRDFYRYGAPSRIPTPDGSWIAFRELGAGPAIVLVHGLMSTSHSHWDLAEILARRFAVILPDRRGRGESGPVGAGDPLECDSNDLALLMGHCSARACIGVSLGGTLALEAAQHWGSSGPLVLFDPPLSMSGSLDWLARFRRELAAGDRVGALVTAMLGTQMGPPGMRMIPRFMLKLMTRQFTRLDEANAPPGARMLELVTTLDRDVEMVASRDASSDGFSFKSPVLLLGSEKSPNYFRQAFSELSRSLVDVRPVELKGLGHDAANNRELGGSPERIAEHILPFLVNHLDRSAGAALAPAASAQSFKIAG